MNIIINTNDEEKKVLFSATKASGEVRLAMVDMAEEPLSTQVNKIGPIMGLVHEAGIAGEDLTVSYQNDLNTGVEENTEEE